MGMDKLFQKRVEDFICEHCGAAVKGNGYTNHCPQCLWSKHVDVNPGDRQATCRGLMEPFNAGLNGGKCIILHRCISCGFEKRNKTSENDNFNAILQLLPA